MNHAQEATLKALAASMEPGDLERIVAALEAQRPKARAKVKADPQRNIETVAEPDGTIRVKVAGLPRPTDSRYERMEVEIEVEWL